MKFDNEQYHQKFNFFMTRSLSYRNQSIDLQSKSMDWFLYDRDLYHERLNMITMKIK